MSSEKNLTEEQAQKAMEAEQIQNFVVEGGKVIVKRTMDEHVTDPDWKGKE